MAATLDEIVSEHWEGMGPAEQRVARYFQENREEVLLASAAELAGKARTSDATVVRAARALGFKGLSDLRRAVADELRSSLSQADRLKRTLGEVGANRGALNLTLDIHIAAIEQLRRSITPALYKKATQEIASADHVHVFGIGPSSALANYVVTQLSRFGISASGLTNTGLLFADDLQRLRKGDLVVMLAYGRVYAELAALLDEVERQGLQSILLTDSLAATLRKRVDLVLPVARGRADLFSMHTATLGLIEALLVGVAALRPKEAIQSLRSLNKAREKLAGARTALPLASKRSRKAGEIGGGRR